MRHVERKTAWILSVILTLWPWWARAQHYHNQHAIGWHWYDDEQEESQEDAPLDPVTHVKTIKHRLETALDEALLQPTPLHVKQYIQLQNAWSEKASQFSRRGNGYYWRILN